MRPSGQSESGAQSNLTKWRRRRPWKTRGGRQSQNESRTLKKPKMEKIHVAFSQSSTTTSNSSSSWAAAKRAPRFLPSSRPPAAPFNNPIARRNQNSGLQTWELHLPKTDDIVERSDCNDIHFFQHISSAEDYLHTANCIRAEEIFSEEYDLQNLTLARQTS